MDPHPETMAGTAMVFNRDKGIYSKHGEDKEVLLAEGYDPCISPDGSKLTFLKFGDNKRREIYLLDLRTGTERKLNVDSENFYGAVWSPDGKYIAFNVWGGADWEIGLIKSDNSDFSRIKRPADFGLYEPTWSVDSKSIIAHSLVDIFEFDLQGNQLQKINIKDTMGEKYSLSSDNRFWITEDRQGFFFSSGIDEGMEGVEGPVVAIIHFVVATKQFERISPPKVYASDLYRIDANKLVFTGTKENETTSDVYAYDVAAKKLEVIIHNATTPSGTVGK
jgi:dipeptidyl aminopeptidase/acylaminoacyl peptidase